MSNFRRALITNKYKNVQLKIVLRTHIPHGTAGTSAA